MLKLGDLVTIDSIVAPPEIYGLGVITEFTLMNGCTGDPMRARVYWSGPALSSASGGTCAIRYLHKVRVK
jgi:hypothetical protein